MPAQDDLYNQMEQILDLLIQTTKRLSESAKHFVSEGDLERLQQRQTEILHEMTRLEENIKKSIVDSPASELTQRRQKIHNKLMEFQSLNQSFVRYMKDHTRVIQKKTLSPNAQKIIAEENTED